MYFESRLGADAIVRDLRDRQPLAVRQIELGLESRVGHGDIDAQSVRVYETDFHVEVGRVFDLLGQVQSRMQKLQFLCIPILCGLRLFRWLGFGRLVGVEGRSGQAQTCY